MPETTIVFTIGAYTLLVAIVAFFGAVIALVWKAKSEIAEAIRKEIDPIKRSDSRLVVAVTEIQTLLQARMRGVVINAPLVEAGASPLRPTSFGARLIRESGLESILDEQKAKLCTKLKAMLPDDYTEYDVQEKARELLLSLASDPMMNPLKTYVYHNPMDIGVILRVGGLWLRDDFLNQPRAVQEDVPEEVPA